MRRRGGGGGFSYVGFYAVLTVLVLVLALSLSVVFYYGNRNEVVRAISLVTTTTTATDVTSTTTTGTISTAPTTTTHATRTVPPTTPSPAIIPAIVRVFQVSTTPAVIGMDISTTTANTPVFTLCDVSFHESEASTLRADQTQSPTLLSTLLAAPLNGVVTFTDAGFLLNTFPISTIFAVYIQLKSQDDIAPRAAAYACYNTETTQYDVFIVFTSVEYALINGFGRCVHDVTLGVYAGTDVGFANQCVYCNYYIRTCEPQGISRLACAHQFIGTTTTSTTGTGTTTSTTTTTTPTTPPHSVAFARITSVFQQVSSPIPIIGQNVSMSQCDTYEYARSLFSFMSGTRTEDQSTDQTPTLVKLAPLLAAPTNGILTYTGLAPITDELATFPLDTVFMLTIFDNQFAWRLSLSVAVSCYSEITSTFAADLTINGHDQIQTFKNCLADIDEGRYIGTDITAVVQCYYCMYYTYNCIHAMQPPNQPCITGFFAGTPVIGTIAQQTDTVVSMNIAQSTTPGYDYANGYLATATGVRRSTQTQTAFVPLDALVTAPVNGVLQITQLVLASVPPSSYFAFQFSTWPRGGNGRTPAVAVACWNTNLGDFSNYITVTGIYSTDNFLSCLAEVLANRETFAVAGINDVNHCNFCNYSTHHCGRTTPLPNTTCIAGFLGPTTTTTSTTTTSTTTPPFTGTTTTHTGVTTTPPPIAYTPTIQSVRAVGLLPWESSPIGGCPIFGVDIQGSSARSTVYLYGNMTTSNNTLSIAAQDTSWTTPAFNSTVECQPDMVFASNYSDLASCITNSIYTGAARKAQPVPTQIFTFTLQMLDARYLKPINISAPIIPSNTVVAQTQSTYFWYIPKLHLCTTIVSGSCTVLGVQSFWDPFSGVDGAYVPTGPYVLDDQDINPLNSISANISTVIQLVSVFYTAQSVNISYIGIGPRNMTNGCIEISTVGAPVLAKRTAAVGTSSPLPLFSHAKSVRGANLPSPQISYIATSGFNGFYTASMHIANSFSPDSYASRLFGYIQIATGQFAGTTVIAQQTQYYSPPWSNVECNTDLTFVASNVTLPTRSYQSSVTSILRTYALAETTPFAYATASFMFVPNSGPYTVEQAVAAAIVPPRTLYYFMYAPGMSAVFQNGTVDINNYVFWNTDIADFASYPICPIDPVYNPGRRVIFWTLSDYVNWAIARFDAFTIVSSKMPAELVGAIEFTSLDPPIYNQTIAPPVYPTTRYTGLCAAAVNCVTTVAAFVFPNQVLCTPGGYEIKCEYILPLGVGVIIYTGNNCVCVY